MKIRLVSHSAVRFTKRVKRSTSAQPFFFDNFLPFFFFFTFVTGISQFFDLQRRRAAGQMSRVFFEIVLSGRRTTRFARYADERNVGCVYHRNSLQLRDKTYI